MIKVIASDLDGTLLNENHTASAQSIAAVREAQDRGICFLFATGRNYLDGKIVIEESGIKCDAILSSGAEVRDCDGNIKSQIAMKIEDIRRIMDVIGDAPVAKFFFGDDGDYMLGDTKEIEDFIVAEMQLFFMEGTEEEIKQTEMFRTRKAEIRCIRDIEEFTEMGTTIIKMFIFSLNLDCIHELKKALDNLPGIASASSFENNIELTDIRAQKGPVLQKYIEDAGYTMDEVMVIGDSLNDYSMMSMDYGATVAMGNAVPELKKVAKYVTKSNVEEGAAYAIRKALAGELEDLRI